MNQSFRVYQVDVFTKDKLSGNPAGVVPDAQGLSPVQMQRIARELGNSETAFLFPGQPGEFDVHIRFFTPTQEVPVCGHATIASHYVRAMELGLDSARVIQKCGAGLFAVEVHKEHGDYRVVMFQGRAQFGPRLSQEQKEQMLSALGIQATQLRGDCPMCSATTGGPKIMVGLNSVDTLHSLKPNMELLKQLSAQTGVNGYHVFTLHPGEKALTHCRMFAPANGNPEDPVTGIANGPLGAYLVKFGLADCSGKEFRFTTVQGEAMGRPGSMEVRVQLVDGQPGEIQISGQAVIAFQTQLELPCGQA